MADGSPTKLRNSYELNALLKDFRADQSWDEFKKKFLRPMVRALDREKDFVALGPAQSDFDLESLKRALPDFVKEDQFFPKLLRTWAQEGGITLEPGQLAELSRLERLIAPGFEDSKTATPIEEWIKLVDPLLVHRPAAVETGDPRRERLAAQLDPKTATFIKLNELRGGVQEIFEKYDRGITLSVKAERREALNALPDDEKKTKQELFKIAENEQQSQLDQSLEAGFAELWEQIWQGDTWAQAMIEVLKKAPESELTGLAVDTLLADPNLDHDPLTAVNQTEVNFGRFLPKLEEQLGRLGQRYRELEAKYQNALDEALRAVLAPPTAPTVEAGGGEEPPEAVTPEDKSRLVDATKKDLRGLLSPLEGLSEEQLQQLADTARKSGVELGQVESLSELEAAIGLDLDQKHADPAVSFAQFEVFSNRLLANFSQAAKAPEKAAPARPAVPGAAPGTLATAMPSEARTEAAARRSVGELMQVQQLMVASGLQELRLVLQKQRIPPQEIERILENHRGALSHQTWLEFLQRGGLQGKLSYSQVVQAWLKSVQDTLDRISVEQGLRKVSLNVKADSDLEGILSEAGYNPHKLEEVFFDLKVDQFEELALFSEQEVSHGAAQRRDDIRGILLNNKFAESDAELAAKLINDNDFTGLFQHQLAKGQLSAEDQQSLSVMLGKTDKLNVSEQENFARILGRIFSEYPPEAFSYLGAEEIATVHQLLARQQKAAEIIARQVDALKRAAPTGPRPAAEVVPELAQLIEKKDYASLIEYQLGRQPPILPVVDRKLLGLLLLKSGLTPIEQQEFARIVNLLFAEFPSDALPRMEGPQLSAVHETLVKQKRAADILAAQVEKTVRQFGPVYQPPAVNPFNNPQTGNLTLAKTETVTEEEAAAHAGETTLLEVTLSVMFPGADLKLVMQQYYANPRSLILLADSIAESYDEQGQPVLGMAASAPQHEAVLIEAQRVNYQAMAQRRQADVGRQRAALAMAVISSGGNPALLAKRFLTDAQAREALIAEIKRQLPKIMAAMGAAAAAGLIALVPPWLWPVINAIGLENALNIAKFIADAAGAASNLASGVGNLFSGAKDFATGLWNGATGGSGTAHSAAAALGKEVGANAATSGKVLSSQALPSASNAAGSTVANTFAATNSFLAATTTAATPAILIFAAILGPMTIAVVMTFMVFTVIGGSLNDLPLGSGTAVAALPGEFGLLNTTDMACVSIDRDSFTAAGKQSLINRAQHIAVLAMQDRDARKICDVAGKINMVYSGTQWGGWGHFSGQTAKGYQVDMGVHTFNSNNAGLFTFFHELGHLLQYESDLQSVHDEVMGSRIVSSYDYAANCRGGCVARTESAAEAVALYLTLPALPPYIIPARVIDIRVQYPALFNALLDFFARL